MKIKEKIKNLFGIFSPPKVLSAILETDNADAFKRWYRNHNDVDLNTCQVDGVPLLMRILGLKSWAVLNEFLTYDVNLDVRHEGGTPLMFAVLSDDVWFAERLMGAGASLNARHEKNGMTPLAFARNNFTLFKKMIDAGADVNIPDLNGETLLMFAAEKGDELRAKLLLGAKAKPNLLNRAGLCAIVYAALSGKKEMAELLKEQGANLELKNEFGLTPLALVCAAGNEKAMDIFLDLGSDVNAKDNLGLTPFMWSMRSGTPKIWQKLKDKGADLNVQDNDGMTALMGALQNKMKDAAVWLLNAGVQMDIEDNEGRTVEHYIQYMPELKPLLEQSRVKVTNQNMPRPNENGGLQYGMI